jgi:hypothetical protein
MGELPIFEISVCQFCWLYLIPLSLVQSGLGIEDQHAARFPSFRTSQPGDNARCHQNDPTSKSLSELRDHTRPPRSGIRLIGPSRPRAAQLGRSADERGFLDGVVGRLTGFLSTLTFSDIVAG